MPFTLEGRTAIVTGAARGIGRAIAQRLLDSGTHVMLNDLDEKLLAESSASLGHPARTRHFAADLTLPATPAALVEATLAAFGSLHIIVNNAGYTWDSVIQKTTDEQFQAMLDIHVVAPFRLLRAASDHIRAAAKDEAAAGQRIMRKIVNITSIAGTDGNPGQAAYGSAKAGIIGLTRTLAKEWGRYNVNVNAVGFGLIETRLVVPQSIASSTLSSSAPSTVSSSASSTGSSSGTSAWSSSETSTGGSSGLQPAVTAEPNQGASAPGSAASTPADTLHMHGHAIKIGVPSAALETLRDRIPLGRLGSPEEAANAVLFFCSPLSDYITGETLIVSGGLHF